MENKKEHSKVGEPMATYHTKVDMVAKEIWTMFEKMYVSLWRSTSKENVKMLLIF